MKYFFLGIIATLTALFSWHFFQGEKTHAQGPVRTVEIYGHQQTVYDDGQGEYTTLSLRTCHNLSWGGKHCDNVNTKMYIGNVNGLPACKTTK